MKALVDSANANAAVDLLMNKAVYLEDFENKNKERLDAIFMKITAAAKEGKVRMYIRECPDLEIYEFRMYLQIKGYSIHEDRVEWHHPQESPFPELR